ncbi:MAG: hypothetical protein AAF492_17295, partial [Verrucomicrobiota bacterium]
VTVLPDSDTDGLRDFIDPDDDNDTFSDLEERIADTDPLNNTSFLWLRIDRTTSPFVQTLSFPSSSNRTYFLQSRTSLYSSVWTTGKTNIFGSGGVIAIPRTNAVDLKYFRLGVEPPAN